MEVDGVFRFGGANGRCSFKSLLLDDGELVEEVVGIGAQLVLTGDLEPEESLYRDPTVVTGKDTFKSLLLDDSIEEEELPFSLLIDKQRSGNLQSALAAAGTEISKDGFKGQDGAESVEKEGIEEARAPPRKKRRGNNSSKNIIAMSSHMSAQAVVSFDAGHRLEHQEPQPMRERPPPLKKKKQPDLLRGALPPGSRKKKQGASSSDVQKLLDSVIARQERFFADLLESMERKEEIREQIRAEKEEKWRAEERAQLDVFNSAMIALTQELLSESGPGCGTQELIGRVGED